MTGDGVESHRQAGVRHMRLGLRDRVGAEMEDRGCQNRGSVAVANTGNQMVEIADTPGRDHRRAHRVRHRAGQRDVVSGLGAVTVHRGEQDFACSEFDDLLSKFDRIDARPLAAAMGEYFPAIGFARQRNLLGVDGDDDALVAELVGGLGDEIRIVHRRSVDRYLVCTGKQQLADVGDLPNAAADGQRHETLFGRPGDDVKDRLAIVRGRGDVEEAKLVRAGRVIGPRRFHRIAGVDRSTKLTPLTTRPSLTSRQGMMRALRVKGRPPIQFARPRRCAAAAARAVLDIETVNVLAAARLRSARASLTSAGNTRP